MKILLFFFVNTIRKALLFAIALKEADKQQEFLEILSLKKEFQECSKQSENGNNRFPTGGVK